MAEMGSVAYWWRVWQSGRKETWERFLEWLEQEALLVVATGVVAYLLSPGTRWERLLIGVLIPLAGLVAWVIGLLIWNFFRAPSQLHSEQTRKIGELKSKIEQTKEPSGPMARLSLVGFQGGLATIDVSNNGTGAYFYAPIHTSGSIQGDSRDVFAKWAHSDEVRTWISHGQTCRLILACLNQNDGFFQWIVPAVAADHKIVERKAHYSSCILSIPVARAPDITLSGSVFAQPDLANGVQSFAAILRAFDAIDALVKTPTSNTEENTLAV